MSRTIWIGVGLVLASLTAGCAGVEPTDDVDDVESSDQIDQASSALLQAPTDGVAAPDRGVRGTGDSVAPPAEFDGQTAPEQDPTQGTMLKMDPEPSPWNQKRNNDT